MDQIPDPPAGMLWAFLVEDGTARSMGEPRLDHAGPGWTWTHFSLGDVRARALLRAAPDLPEAARELFLLNDDRVQVDDEAGWTFGVLPDFGRDLAGKPVGEGRVVFAIDGRRLITGRLHPLHTVDLLRRRIEAGEALGSPAVAVCELLEIYLGHLEGVFDGQGAHLAKVEDHILADPQNPGDASLSAIRRGLARHRRELQALRSALIRAQGGRRGRTPGLLAEGFADLAPWIEDVDREAAGLQDRARLLHEEIDTLINSATNRSMRALTVISTLLIPPTLIVGAFGMNVGGIPWAQGTAGFTWVCGLCVAVVGSAIWLLRRMDLLP